MMMGTCDVIVDGSVEGENDFEAKYNINNVINDNEGSLCRIEKRDIESINKNSP